MVAQGCASQPSSPQVTSLLALTCSKAPPGRSKHIAHVRHVRRGRHKKKRLTMIVRTSRMVVALGKRRAELRCKTPSKTDASPPPTKCAHDWEIASCTGTARAGGGGTKLPSTAVKCSDRNKSSSTHIPTRHRVGGIKLVRMRSSVSSESLGFSDAFHLVTSRCSALLQIQHLHHAQQMDKTLRHTLHIHLLISHE